jgi:protein-L-isoaspartate(D-aspartate) O-methyltransferase
MLVRGGPCPWLSKGCGPGTNFVTMERKKHRLMREIRREVADERVLAAFESVHREAFVLPELYEHAYDNTPLPIGEGQTISQPLMVAIMVAAIQPKSTDVVLDVGTGSGYQAAVLSRLVSRVVGMERLPSFVERARAALRAEGIENVAALQAGDELGLPGRRFDGIVVGAAAPSVPRSLIAQLADGGRLVVPVGSPFDQNLARVTRHGDGTHVDWLGPCRFVPLIGPEGWPEELATDHGDGT